MSLRASFSVWATDSLGRAWASPGPLLTQYFQCNEDPILGALISWAQDSRPVYTPPPASLHIAVSEGPVCQTFIVQFLLGTEQVFIAKCHTVTKLNKCPAAI